MTLIYKTEWIEYILSKENIHITDSYKIQEEADMCAILALIRAKARDLNYLYQRSNRSWIAEWKAHNILYKIGFEKARTKSVDLNEDENIFKRICYFLIALFYKFVRS